MEKVATAVTDARIRLTGIPLKFINLSVSVVFARIRQYTRKSASATSHELKSYVLGRFGRVVIEGTAGNLDRGFVPCVRRDNAGSLFQRPFYGFPKIA